MSSSRLPLFLSEEVLSFLKKENKSTYPQFYEWILKQVIRSGYIPNDLFLEYARKYFFEEDYDSVAVAIKCNPHLIKDPIIQDYIDEVFTEEFKIKGMPTLDEREPYFSKDTYLSLLGSVTENVPPQVTDPKISRQIAKFLSLADHAEESFSSRLKDYTLKIEEESPVSHIYGTGPLNPKKTFVFRIGDPGGQNVYLIWDLLNKKIRVWSDDFKVDFLIETDFSHISFNGMFFKHRNRQKETCFKLALVNWLFSDRIYHLANNITYRPRYKQARWYQPIWHQSYSRLSEAIKKGYEYRYQY